MTTEATPGHVGSHAGLGLLLIGPHDHPEPHTMKWSDLELAAIKEYAARCVASERERWAAIAKIHMYLNAQSYRTSRASGEGPLDAVVGPQTHGGNDGNLG